MQAVVTNENFCWRWSTNKNLQKPVKTTAMISSTLILLVVYAGELFKSFLYKPISRCPVKIAVGGRYKRALTGYSRSTLSHIHAGGILARVPNSDYLNLVHPWFVK